MAKSARVKGRQVKLPKTGGKADTNAVVLAPTMSGLSLIDGECETDYQAFHESCLRAVEPKDAIERIWLQDFVDYSWEANRLRRLKVALIQATRKEAVRRLLRDCLGSELGLSERAKILAEGWLSGEGCAIIEVEELLERHEHDTDSIMALAVSISLRDIERIDRLIASYDYRRDAALRELEKRRDVQAKRARDLADVRVIDIETGAPQAAE